SLGARHAALHIDSNDSGESPFDIDLTGAGVAAVDVAQQAYLKASNTGAEDFFGWSVAVSGDTVAVGAVYEDSNATGIAGDQTNNNAVDSGAVYIFTRSGSTWSQQAYLKPSDTREGREFGWAV